MAQRYPLHPFDRKSRSDPDWAFFTSLLGEGRLQPITDETRDHVAVSGWSLERLAQALLGDVHLAPNGPTDQELEAQLATIALRDVIPKDISRVPVDKILEVRRRHTKARARFQQHIREVLAEIPGVHDVRRPEIVEQYLAVAYEKKLQPEMDELNDELNALAVDTVWTALGVKVAMPAAVTTTANLAGVNMSGDPLLMGVAAAGAMAYSILPALRRKRAQAKQAQQASDVAYLLHVEEQLQPQTLTSWIAERTRQFILGV